MKLLDDINPLEAVFQTYRHNTLDDIRSKLSALEGMPSTVMPSTAVEGVKQSLALLACQERRADVLKFCLDEGEFPIAATMDEEANRVDVDKDPETFNVLRQSRQFQQIRERNEERRKYEEEYGGATDPSAVFDKGGKLPVPW